ncbi:MAG: hypothetical protein P8X83_02890 [Nitrosopumilaceae archaeon]
MNKTTKVLSVAVAMFAIVGMMTMGAQQALAENGNGAGGVGKGGYQLNLIGVHKNDQLPNDGNPGHRIFINLDGKSKIKLYNANLTDGTFKVIDADATDQNGGAFQLPPPNTDCTNTESDPYYCDESLFDYQVFIRPLGQPQEGNFKMATCGEYTYYNGTAYVTEEICSLDQVEVPSANGPGKKAKFDNVSRELLTACLDTYDDLNFDGSCDVRVDIFDETLENWFWETDNSGFRLIQLRFIPTIQLLG